jgi:transposase-like protein
VMALLTGQKGRVDLLRTHDLADSTLEGWLQEFRERGPEIFESDRTTPRKQQSGYRIG